MMKNFCIPVLFYADGGLQLAQSCEEAEEMIRMVVEVAGECGLCVNKEKSSAVLYNCWEGKLDKVVF